MRAVVNKWFRNYFSDEEAVYLFFFLLGGLLFVLFFGRMLAPVLAALILAYLLQGLVGMLERWRVPRRLAVWLVFLMFAGLLVVTLLMLLPMLWKQTFNVVQDQLPRILTNGEHWLRGLPDAYPEFVSMHQIDILVARAETELAGAGQAVLTLSLASIPGMLEAVVFVVLLPLLVFFFMMDRDIIVQWFAAFLPQRRNVLSRVWHEMDQQIANYVRGKSMEILIVGITTYVLLSFLGLGYAVLLSVLVGLSVVIPYIGATLVTLPVAAVAWVQFGWGSEFAMIMMVYAVIQFLDANVLVPLIFSEAVNLHPVAIITAILFFGGLWGFWGVFFAIPLATLLKAVINAWPNLRSAAHPPDENAATPVADET